MTDEFQKGLITGLAMQPLQVTTEHAERDPDAPDIYNVSFETHNVFANPNVFLSNQSWGSVDITDNIATLQIVSDVPNAWYTITQPIPLQTNCLYKIACSHNQYYGRFGFSTHGGGNNIYEYGHQNCTCAFGHDDNHMLIGGDPTPTTSIKSTIFMVVPSIERADSQSVYLMWCPDVTLNDAKESYSLPIGLYKQVM